ncbi:hypothetical protein AAF712_010219 [Marasmius tenuissimus]|uniref:RNA polymerase II-associated factor 1 homolog n=1 Tax=Marasmius tenuissimus TaxID=585030 RepID=A0ABR2ZQ86_9AGAR
MSFKKSKLDLLVRVRYANPLPPPPCPPKLLDIPTTPMRYARPEFLNSLANNTPLPMIVDAELGMPLDLGKWESLWEENPDDSALNPDINNLPKLDPRDEFLAYDQAGPSGSFTNGHVGTGTPSSGAALGSVTWLRKTEYTSDRAQRSAAEPKHVMLALIDVSREAQLRDIEASFLQCNENFSLETLRHPNKPNVVAEESFEILPDSDIWANQYDLFRFSERPGERNIEEDDPRLDCAVLRPMKIDHDSFLAYYLTPDDESALSLKEKRKSARPYEVPEDHEETEFRFVRDYETVKVEQEVPNEFLLVLDDGPVEDDLVDEVFNDDRSSRRPKGAYYKNIERKMFLKKKRQNIYDPTYEDKWEIMRVTHALMSQEEEEERDEALAEVVDPLFLMRGEADAEGDEDFGIPIPITAEIVEP